MSKYKHKSIKEFINEIKLKILEEILFNPQKFNRFFKNIEYIKYCKPSEEVEQYIEFIKKNNFILWNYIKCIEDIPKYFDKDGIKDTLYEIALFDRYIFSVFFNNIEYSRNYNPGEEVKQYIKFTKKNDFILDDYIKCIEDISKYFDKDGIKDTLYEIALFDRYICNIIFNNIEYLNNSKLSDEVKQYIKFIKENNIILDAYIKGIEDISKYFDKDGIKTTLYEIALFDRALFISLFDNIEYSKNYNPSDEVKQYIEFTKKNSFIFKGYINNIDDIPKYFDKNGVKLFDLIKLSIEDIEVFEYLDKRYFEEFYKEKFATDELKFLLELIDNDYKYFSKFIIDTSLVIHLDKDKLIFYNDYISNVDKNTFADIIKYVYYSKDEITYKFVKILKNKEYKLLLNVYNLIYNEWDVKKFRLLINNFEDNKLLCKNIECYSNFDESMRYKLIRILINGDQTAKGKIQTLDDLTEYNNILYKSNENIIFSDSIKALKILIFESLFNMNITSIRRIIDMYDKSNKLKNIEEFLVNSQAKKDVKEYSEVIKFIKKIYNSVDIHSLRMIAKKINECYKNNNLEVLYNFWDEFSNLESNILNICGIEINEKIINFDELINTPKDDIPQNKDGSLSFNVSSVKLKNDFEYDGQKINAGSSVKLIELNGIPFVALGHVLNAYGIGGKLSDFNHPRVIGKTHLSLSAIDDNFYQLVERDVVDINHVQILFTELPSNKLLIASEIDVGSQTANNSLNITSYIYGNFNSIRENISKTSRYSNQYNEYVYYREGLMPSAILIKGDEPLECELQATVYLSKITGKDIPLVRINKERYPVRTYKKMKKRDKELQLYYEELCKRRKLINTEREIDRLKEIKELLVTMRIEPSLDEIKKVI